MSKDSDFARATTSHKGYSFYKLFAYDALVVSMNVNAHKVGEVLH
jgi:hypothetical protein